MSKNYCEEEEEEEYEEEAGMAFCENYLSTFERDTDITLGG